MVKQDSEDLGRPFMGGGAPGGDAIAERMLAVGFLAALGIWIALAFALGAT
jgi:hypothetical protein